MFIMRYEMVMTMRHILVFNKIFVNLFYNHVTKSLINVDYQE